jgi:hypothetical protein
MQTLLVPSKSKIAFNAKLQRIFDRSDTQLRGPVGLLNASFHSRNGSTHRVLNRRIGLGAVLTSAFELCLRQNQNRISRSQQPLRFQPGFVSRASGYDAAALLANCSRVDRGLKLA